MRALKAIGKNFILLVLVCSFTFIYGMPSVFAYTNDGSYNEYTLNDKEKLNENIKLLYEKINLIKNSEIKNNDLKNNIENILSYFNEPNTINIYLDDNQNDEFLERIFKITSTDSGINIIESNIINEDVIVSATLELTTTYTYMLDYFSDLINNINQINDANENITSINNKLIDLESIIKNDTMLYNLKSTSINDTIDNINFYLLKINTTTLKNQIELYSSNCENVTELVSRVNELVTNLTSNTEYNKEVYLNYLGQYNLIKYDFDQYVYEYADTLISEISVVNDETSKENVVQKINTLFNSYQDSYNILNQQVQEFVNNIKQPTNEDDEEKIIKNINNITDISEYNFYNDVTLNLLNKTIEIYKNKILKLEIQGKEFSYDEILAGNTKINVTNSVTSIDYNVEVPEGRYYEVSGDKDLKVGDNIIEIKVYSNSDIERIFTVIVTRLEKYVDQGDVVIPNEDATNTNETAQTNQSSVTPLVSNTTQTESTTEAVLTTTADEQENDNGEVSNDSNDTDDSIESNDTDEKSEDEKNTESDEIDEEESEEMSPLTTILVLIGIALVGFGIYLLFGNDEDNDDVITKTVTPSKEEKVEIKKIEIKNDKPTPNKTDNKKTPNKKNNSTNKKNPNKK